MTRSRISAVCMFATVVLLIAVRPFPVFAQETSSANAVVPTLVQLNGVLTGGNGKPLTSITGVTFSLYAEQEGGAPLWLETQNVQPDTTGHYSVMLGSTTGQGLPSSLFVSGQARWLGIQPQGQAAQPRVMLLSVPYALKAGDAQTLNGQPASAFLAASRNNAASGNGVINNAISGGGTTDYVPLWLSSKKLGNSNIFQGASGDVGIATTTPGATLDVNGTINTSTSYNVGGNLFAFGSATSMNAFLGFAGNTTGTGGLNTASGWAAFFKNTTGDFNTVSGGYALYSNTSGGWNTAIGEDALIVNTTGSYNSASGLDALASNTTGNYNTGTGLSALINNTTGIANTAIGAFAGPSSGGLNNSTAVGAYAQVTASNAMVLGPISGVNNCTPANSCASVNVGIGTTAPTSVLTVSGADSSPNGFAASIKLANTASGGANWYLRTGATGTNTPAGGFSLANDNSYWMTINGSNGDVGLGGITSPSHPLTMADGAYEAGGTWTNASDRNLKEAFEPVDEASLLAKLNTIPMQTWRYKSESTTVRHLGPMAQDFHTAFALGLDDKHISTVDEGGVALAAAQALYREVRNHDATVSYQQKQIDSLTRRIRSQQAQITLQAAQIEAQQAAIVELMSQVKAIQVSLKTNGGTGLEVRTVKTQVPLVRQ